MIIINQLTKKEKLQAEGMKGDEGGADSDATVSSDEKVSSYMYMYDILKTDDNLLIIPDIKVFQDVA
jgi:hypothetical protein